MSVVTESHVIGGLKIRIHRGVTTVNGSIAVVFMLHGRLGSSDDVAAFASACVKQAEGQKRGLYIVTLDHRNHGSRLVDEGANKTWVEGNERHAADMYAIQNPRITVGVPIIGCPDYSELMKQRAQTSGIQFAEPHVPTSLLALVSREDPASKNYSSLEASNPFLGKKILVLSGEEDRLVPWTASQKFVESLAVGPRGKKIVDVEKGVGHECTQSMAKAAADFIVSELLN